MPEGCDGARARPHRRRRAAGPRPRPWIACTRRGLRANRWWSSSAVDAGALRAPEIEDRPPYALTPAFEFARERLYFLARSNNYDGRNERLVWGPAIEAARVGAKEGGTFDVVLPDGTPAWIDGGPRLGAIPGVEGAVVHRVRIAHGDLTPDRRRADRRRARARPVASRRPQRRRGADHRARRVGQDAGAHRAVPATRRAPRLGPESGVRGRVQRAGQGRDGASDSSTSAARPCARSARCTRSATTSCAAPDPCRTCSASGTFAAGSNRSCRSARARTPTCYAPYLEALGEVRLGLVAPAGRRGATRRRRRLRGDVRRVTATGCATTRSSTTTSRSTARSKCCSPTPTIRAQLQAECRHLLVDEFQDLTPAQLLMLRLVARARLRRVRRRRRRPGDLRLRRRRPEVPHRLRPVLSRRGAPPARSELPLPGRHRRARRRTCSPTTGCGCRRRSARPSPKAPPARLDRTPAAEQLPRAAVGARPGVARRTVHARARSRC